LTEPTSGRRSLTEPTAALASKRAKAARRLRGGGSESSCRLGGRRAETSGSLRRRGTEPSRWLR
jgi:hypothetical protein